MNAEINLCDTCTKEFATCVTDEEIEFGDGWGNDNVTKCNQYERKEN